jgi:hypothetical protein
MNLQIIGNAKYLTGLGISPQKPRKRRGENRKEYEAIFLLEFFSSVSVSTLILGHITCHLDTLHH